MPYARNQIQKLREDRRKLGEEMRKIHDLAIEEKRDLKTEEKEKFDAMHADGERLRSQIEREELVSGYLVEDHPAAKRGAAVDPNVDPPQGLEPSKKPDEREAEKAGTGPRDTAEYRALFNQFLAAPNQAVALTIAQRAYEFRVEHRDLQVDSDTQGGFLVPPEQFVVELLKNVDDATPIRGMARKFTVRQAKSLGVPTGTAKASTWVWGTELSTPTVDSSLAFGKRELYPRHATGEIKVSRDFLRSSLLPAEQIIREEIARDGGEHQEEAFLLGTGAGQPLGVFVASADGIPSTRDVSTGNTTSAVTIDGLTNAKYAIKSQYWPRLTWLGHRDFHKNIYSIRDGIGRPIFVESLRIGEPDRVMGFPLVLDEFAPSTFTTGLYVAILGDWSMYWIADALDMELQRLDELYARSNQVGFIGRLKVDAMPVLAECWSRVKLG